MRVYLMFYYGVLIDRRILKSTMNIWIKLKMVKCFFFVVVLTMLVTQNWVSNWCWYHNFMMEMNC